MKSNKLIIPGVLLLVGLLVFIVALVSWFARPEWRTTPAGALILIGVALTGVVVIVKNLIDIINGVFTLIPKFKPEEPEPPSPYKTPYSQYFYDCYCKAPGKTDLSRAEFDQALWSYLDWVRRDYNQARLYAERPPRGENLPVRKLEEVFIPLTLRRSTQPSLDEMRELDDKQEDPEIDKHRAYLRAMERRKREGDILPMKELLTASNRLAIIGGAGSGKSTLAAYLAYSLAEAAQTGSPLPYDLPDGVKAMIPILVPLRSYRYYQREHHVHDLHAFIPRYINDRSAKLRLPEAFFECLLQTAPCLLILDGLDEVVSTNERGTVRERIEQLARSIYPAAFFIVTAREAGYQENAILGDDFSRLDVQDLEEDEINTLVGKWCRLLKDLEGQVEEITTKIREINQRYISQGLPPLIATPLMVTMVVSARWAENTELPRDRAKLYELVVKAILSSQYTEQSKAREEVVSYGGPWEHQRQWLSKLALEMHQGGQAGAAIPEKRVRALLEENLPAETVTQFIEAIRYRGSLFEERDELFQFVHLTFQEFLAARYIFHQKDRLLNSLQNRLLDPWWREVLLLVYGYARIDDLEFAQRYLEWLSSQPDRTPARLAGLELAGAALLEVELPPAATRQSQAQMLADALEDDKLDAPAALRARAGDTLAQLGDPRFDPDHWYLPADSMLGFVQIPEGTFLMGSDPENDPDSYDNEQSRHEVHLPTFYIARYPVTVAQFRSFVDDSGFKFDNWRRNTLPNHPVVEVLWHEALEYCRWLQGKLSAVSRQRAADPDISQAERSFWEGLAFGRLQVTLPSEAEWEKAARGTDGRIYPWGDDFDSDKANTLETGIRNTSAVGCFPGGASPYGVLDLSGNVWEWTRSKDLGYPYQANDGREDLGASRNAPRVLRGGFFYDNRRLARCAFRYWYFPNFRFNHYGFRVVVSPG